MTRAERPVCLFCREQRVKKTTARYCSRSCASSATNQHNARRANEINRERARTRLLQAIVADCRGLVDADGRIPLKVAVTVVVKHRRLGYERGWAAMWQRVRRGYPVRGKMAVREERA